MVAHHRARAQKELISFVRANSPFYNAAWKHLPEPSPSSIEDLPITDSDAYWRASSQSPNQTFAMPFIDGTVMRSGGSTGNPKVVYMTRDELKTTASVKAVAMAQGCGFVPGDRIAQLSNFGGMYGSYQLFNNAFQAMPVPHVLLPIGGDETLDNKLKYMEEFGATVLLSNPSTARQLADRLVQQGKTLPDIRLISYTGEAVTKGLRAAYAKGFPNAALYPSLYGSIDAGPIGIPARPFTDPDDDILAKYKVLAPLLVLEILDDQGQPIRQNGVKGTVIVTSLVKRLQPMLRYPTGDIASWVDFHNEIFQLHGRDGVGIKILNAQFTIAELRNSIEEALGDGIAQGSQFAIRRLGDEGTQELTFRIVAKEPSNADAVIAALNEKLGILSKRFKDQQQRGYIAPLRVEWISVDQLQLKSSGKVSDIVEARF